MADGVPAGGNWWTLRALLRMTCLGRRLGRSLAVGGSEGGEGLAHPLPPLPERLVDPKGEEQLAGTEGGPDDLAPDRRSGNV